MLENKMGLAVDDYYVIFRKEAQPVAEMVLGMIHRALIEETLRNLGKEIATALSEFLSAKEKQLTGQELWPLVSK